jgi:prolipoprotein diacylglyceryltransferase
MERNLSPVPRLIAMRDPSLHSSWISPNTLRGPGVIGAGIAMMIFASCCQGAAILTAVALITLGATQVTLARHRDTALLLPITILHLATYATLYALFLGATIHAANTNADRGIQWFVVLDVATSLVPLGLAAQRVSTRLL